MNPLVPCEPHALDRASLDITRRERLLLQFRRELLVPRRALEDVDVVFGYPRGGEEPMMPDAMRQFGRRDALLVLNDTNEGLKVYRAGKEFLQTL